MCSIKSHRKQNKTGFMRKSRAGKQLKLCECGQGAARGMGGWGAKSQRDPCSSQSNPCGLHPRHGGTAPMGLAG